MRQEALNAALGILSKHTSELDDGQDPVEILYNASKTPRVAAKKILEELCEQDKIGLLMDGDRIIAAFVDRGLEKEGKPTPFRPNAVVLADVANIQHAKELPGHIFPGEAINAQLKGAGFIVRDRFAFITTKGLHTNPPATTASGIITQAEILFQHGFIPVLCPFVDEKRPSPDDDMLARVARFCHGHPDIESFVVISGDRDFSQVKEEAEMKGHDFHVFTPSSNISSDWRRRSRATTLNFNVKETEACGFIRRYLEAINGGRLLTTADEDEKNAILFLDHVVQAIKKTDRETDFIRFTNTVWDKLPESLRKVYRRQFLNEVMQLLASETDIVSKRSHFMKNNHPGTLFSFHSKSKILWVFTGDDEKAQNESAS
ncbi:MAG: hypothetical protein WAP23_03810 [Candidatus Spechtbacterales bacterium]